MSSTNERTLRWTCAATPSGSFRPTLPLSTRCFASLPTSAARSKCWRRKSTVRPSLALRRQERGSHGLLDQRGTTFLKDVQAKLAEEAINQREDLAVDLRDHALGLIRTDP